MGLFRPCKTAVLKVNVILWDSLCMWAEGGVQTLSKVDLFWPVFGTALKTFCPHKLIA